MTWTGTDPVKWAQAAIKKAQAAPRFVVEEMANAMATSVRASGFTPVDTGNLSRSVTISLAPIKRDGPGYNSPVRQDYNGAVKGIPYDGATYIAYKAIYAARVNYGFVGTDSLGRSYNQAGRAFLEANIARFPQVVQKAVARLNYVEF